MNKIGGTRLISIVLMIALLIALYFFGFGKANAAPAPANPATAANTGATIKDWVWISSNAKYSKYFSPTNVKVTQKIGDVATVILAKTRTTYDYSGATETVTNLKLTSVNPAELKSSIAEVEIVPQNRTISYVVERFYDANGKQLVEKKYNPRTLKEINSQSFDEDFYTAIVDQVFRHGETERRKASDRWFNLVDINTANGGKVHAIADSTTMRLKGSDLIYWEWEERKDADDNVIEIRFMKKAVNLDAGTVKVIKYQHWAAKTGWKEWKADVSPKTIDMSTSEGDKLRRLRLYNKGYQFWLNRYRIE